MRKAWIGFAMAGSLFLVSCKKEKEPEPVVEKKPPVVEANAWSIDTNKFTFSSLQKNTESIYFYDKSGGMVAFEFKTWPTKDATYNVVANTTGILGDNEMGIFAKKEMSGSTYFSTSDGARTVTVKVTEGKLSFKCTDVPLADKGIVPGTVKLTANVYNP